MSRTTGLTQPILILFLLSLLIRTGAALALPYPANMDEAYHTVNAQTLARGEGFTEHFIWNYLNPAQSVSHPGHLYWMPLTSLIAWAGMALAGPTYPAGQIGFVALAALFPPLGWWMIWRFNQNRRHAWLVGLLLLFSGFYFPVWTAIDTYTPFALAGAICLFAAWQMAQTGSSRWAVVAGLAAGLGHLARADGPLLLLTLGAALLLARPRLTRRQIIRLGGIGVLGYLLVMGPWFWRNWQVTGAVLPPGGSKTMWLTHYDDLFSVNKTLSLPTYLAWGWGPIIRSKLEAGWLNLQTLFAAQGLIVAFPLALAGAWQCRRHLLIQLVAIYTLLLAGTMTLVFTFPGPRGALFHSGGAILPVGFAMAAIGLDSAIAAIARRRSTWRAQSARQVFGAALVIVALGISLFIFSRKIAAGPPNPAYPEIAAYLSNQQATVMLGNPPYYLYRQGYRAIALPNEPIDTALAVADTYGATWLAIDRNYPAPLEPYFSQQADHTRLKLEKTFSGPTYLYRILP